MPDPATDLPAQGGSYTRDPKTGALTPIEVAADPVAAPAPPVPTDPSEDEEH